MIHTQRSPGGEVITTIIREFTPQEMKTVLTAGDVVSTRVYYKVD